MARLTRDGSSSAPRPAPPPPAPFPHVWIRPAWAQAKEVRVLAWSHFVPAYDKWFDDLDRASGASKSGVKAVIDHVPHLQIPAKIAAEIATQSGHDIVQLVGSGAEKWADGARATSRTSPTRSARSTAAGPRWPRTTPRPRTGSSTRIPDFFIDFPGLYRKDLWTEIGMPNGPDSWEELHQGGMKLKAKGFPVGIGLAHHDDSRASWRAIMWSFGGSEVAKDGKTITYNRKECARRSSSAGALQGRHDPRGPRLGRRVQQPPARLRARLVDPQPDQRVPHASRGRTRSSRRKIFVSLSPKGPAVAALLRELPRVRHHQVLEEPGRGEGLPGGPGRQLPRGRQGHRPATTCRC